MNDERRDAADNVDVVERFIASFDRRWPTEDELAELVAPAEPGQPGRERARRGRDTRGPLRIAAGRIVRIEQHDCYEQPRPPEA